MNDPKSILYKPDYVPSHKTDIRKTFAKLQKKQKKVTEIPVPEKTQPINISQYKKYK